MEENIYPIYSRMLPREDKERLLGQRGAVVWMTGLSGSGKSTVALSVERELHALGIKSAILAGDYKRAGLCNTLGISGADRRVDVRRIAEVSKLMAEQGLVVLACFVSPTREIRNMARNIIGADDFCEVYVSTPIEECERRDVKGLYARARRGEVKDFTGISAPFEEPLEPALSLDTSKLSLRESAMAVVEMIKNKSTR